MDVGVAQRRRPRSTVTKQGSKESVSQLTIHTFYVYFFHVYFRCFKIIFGLEKDYCYLFLFFYTKRSKIVGYRQLIILFSLNLIFARIKPNLEISP